MIAAVCSILAIRLSIQSSLKIGVSVAKFAKARYDYNKMQKKMQKNVEKAKLDLANTNKVGLNQLIDKKQLFEQGTLSKAIKNDQLVDKKSIDGLKVEHKQKVNVEEKINLKPTEENIKQETLGKENIIKTEDSPIPTNSMANIESEMSSRLTRIEESQMNLQSALSKVLDNFDIMQKTIINQNETMNQLAQISIQNSENLNQINLLKNDSKVVNETVQETVKVKTTEPTIEKKNVGSKQLNELRQKMRNIEKAVNSYNETIHTRQSVTNNKQIKNMKLKV